MGKTRPLSKKQKRRMNKYSKQDYQHRMDELKKRRDEVKEMRRKKQHFRLDSEHRHHHLKGNKRKLF